MPYGKFAEGNRVADFAEDGDIDDRDFNEIQDQLKAMLGPRWWSAPLAAMHAKISDEGTVWVDTSAGIFITTSKNSAECYVPISLPTGCKITEVRSVVSGGASISSSGGVYFGALSEGSAVTYKLVQSGWPNAGSGHANSVTSTTDPTGSGDYIVADDSVIWWRVVFPSNAAGNDARVWGLRVKTQFGN